MKLNARVSVLAITALAAALIGSVACEDSATNAPASEGGAASGKGGTTTTDVGGAAATGGASATPGAGGTSSGVGGSSAATGGAATSSAGGSDGTCNYPAASSPPPNGGLVCAAGETKGGACTTEGAVCWKTCGPTNSSGWKTETCTGGVIVEVSACQWSGSDYSAFKIPATLAAMDASCPDGTPQASQACTANPCASCADKTTGAYLDSSGASKSGWCTCTGTTSMKWTCGTAGTAWPCPGNPANPGC